jgi:preprotein translocase subunit SecG
MSAIFAIILTLLAIFLILLVLVQRGRGGGLAGALGGMGGSSAFGAKAGDVFTRITIITASIWITISIIAFFWAAHRGDALSAASTTGAGGGAASDAIDLLPQREKGEAQGPAMVAPPAEDKEGAPAGPSAPANTPAMPAEGSTPPAGDASAPPADTK